MRRPGVALLIALICLLAAGLLRLLAGGQGLHWPEDPVFLQLRLDRLISGLVVGGALALSGVGLQCLLRNPLAAPDLLGLASGAGLGAMVVIALHYAATGQIETHIGGQGAGALVGSCLSLGVVYVLSQRRGVIDPTSLILMGVIIGLMCSAGIMIVQHMLPDQGVRTSRWLMGAIIDDTPGWRQALVGGMVLLAIVGGVVWGRWLDAASLAEDEAKSVGVPLGRVRVVLLIASGALAAGSVWIAGPIGFVGLVAPHLARLLGGPGHRLAVVVAALLGGAVVVGADGLLSTLDLRAGRLPLGVVTTLLGGPVFLWMLFRMRGRSGG